MTSALYIQGPREGPFQKRKMDLDCKMKRVLTPRAYPVHGHKSCATEVHLNVFKGGQSPRILQVHPD